MAKLCFIICSIFFIYLFILIKVSQCIEFLANTDIYLYSTDLQYQRPKHFTGIEFLETDTNTHAYQKRDISDQADHSHEEALLSIVNNNLSTTLPQQFDFPKNLKLSQLKLNSTLPQLNLEGKAKNLGINGTGQKNFYSTPLPPLVHEPENISYGNGTDKIKTKSTLPESVTAVTPKTDDLYESDLSGEVDVNENYINQTLSKHNITITKTDTHQYYNSSFITSPVVGMFHWVNMTNRHDVKTNDLLSNSHRRAATIQLSFEFPFYGHLIKNVTIATGGFLYTGEYVHSWLAATQYIAPLMSNFDTSLSNESFIKYFDNGTAFTVQWQKVALQDKPKDGEFTFQVTLHKNGDIIFVYQNVPLLIKDIKNDHHPVKVGLSDAYITDKTIFLVRRKTIYEYHRVNFAKEDIKNWTVIHLNALPTCLNGRDCDSCLTLISDFDCVWCSKVNKCSSGVDRNHQEWVDKGCDSRNISKMSKCYLSNTNLFTYNSEDDEFSNLKMYDAALKNRRARDQVGVSGIFAILFLIVMVCGLTTWVLYAYRNPHTTSGQILIRYRPTQWRWRRGEARYTAATIHM